MIFRQRTHVIAWALENLRFEISNLRFSECSVLAFPFFSHRVVRGELRHHRAFHGRKCLTLLSILPTFFPFGVTPLIEVALALNIGILKRIRPASQLP